MPVANSREGDRLHPGKVVLFNGFADSGGGFHSFAQPDGDASTVHSDDTFGTVKDGSPESEGVVGNGASVFKDELHSELTASAVERIDRVRFFGADDLHRT